MHPLAAPGTLWVLSSDGKYLVRPQADETSHKKQTACGRQEKGLPFFSRITKDFASAEATKGLSGRPLETFGPLLRMGNSTRNRFLVAGRKRAFLAFLASQRISPLRRRPKGFPVALWKPSALCCVWGIPQGTGFLRKAREEPSLLSTYHRGFRLCGGDQGAFRSPPGPLRPFAAHGGFHKKQIPCGRHEKGLPFPLDPFGAHPQNLTQAAEPLPPGAFHRLSSFIPLCSVPIPPLPRDAS